MKKMIVIALMCIVIFGLWAARPRSYTQLLVNNTYPGQPADPTNYQLPNLTNTSSSTSPDYILSAYITVRPTEIISTLIHPSSTIRVFRFGNGTTVPYVSAAVLGFGTFTTDWTGGETIHFDITHIPTGQTGSWELVIPDNATTSIGYRQTLNPIPYVIAPPSITPTYSLTITSTPDGKPIYKDNVDTGHVTPYTFDPGEAGTYKVVDPLYTWEPAEIVVPELTENTTINFVGTLIPDTYTYNLHIEGPPGYAVTGPSAELSGTIPYTKTSNVVTDLVGEYTVAAPPPGYQWVVNPITVTADMFQLATKKTGGMNKVVLGSRTNGAKANYVYEATINFVLEEIPIQYYNVLITSEPAGAAIFVGGVDSEHVTPWTFQMQEGTSATYTVVMDHYTWEPTEFVVTNISENLSCNFLGTPHYDIPEGVPTPPPDATVTVTITITGGNANYGSGVLPPWVNPSFEPLEQYFLSLIGTGPWTITFNTTAPWAAYFLGEIWHAVQNTGENIITFTIDGAKDVPNVPIVLGNEDPTLPVELSYFAATLTAENFVNIAWTTQTETNMNGFNIYRNDGSDNLASAIQIAYIPATNTSTTQNYNLIDREVENNHTYYYWLECVEMNNHSTFNGPSPVYVDGTTPPILPEYTKMHNAYPNPFRAGSGTTIAVEVKKGDSGTVTIYNILGQVVKTFSLTEGTNNLNWNGRDSKGNLCGNGIYFYKLSTNSLNQTKKMVIVK